MKKIYTKSELQEILDAYANPDLRESTIERAKQLLKDYADENVDIEQSALDEFRQIINTFGGTQNDSGDVVLNETGAKAMACLESIVAAMENAENLADKNRIFSLTSDQNQIKFDLITLQIYRDMGLVEQSVDASNMTPSQVAETINAVNLTPKQKEQYSDLFVGNVINNPELFELLPPKILTDAYLFTREQYSKKPKDENLAKRFTTLAKRMDYLISSFAKKSDYYYSDPSNIADVYAGYRKMCDVRKKDLAVGKSDNDEIKEYKQKVTKSIDKTTSRLEEIIAMYSDMWNLKDLKSKDAEKLDARWQEISDTLRNIELTDEILSTLAKYKFLDENGKPLPQFIDADGNPQIEFKSGYKLNPDSRLNRIIALARNDVTMRNVGDLQTDVKDMDLTTALFDRVPWKMAEISIPDQVISGIKTKPHQMLTQQGVDKFWKTIDTSGGDISDTGYQAALDAQVNQAAGFAGMMAEKVGHDKEIVLRPFKAIEDIDKLAKTRSEKIGADERKQKIKFGKRCLKNFSAATLMSAGLTFIGKATGVAYAGAAIGTAIGVGNMVVQGFKWRREQKKAGKPHGLGTFLSDKRNWGPALTTALGTAAVIFMATGNPELATGLGIGAMAVGGTSSATMVYKDALAAGYTKGQALSRALCLAGATIAGGFAGRAAMTGVINYVNNNTDSNLFKTETVTTHETTERVYDDGVIKHHENMMLKNNWETPGSLDAKIDGLMNAGLSHDDAMRYLVAWHDATDHNLGPGYFDSIGMSPDALAALRGSISGTTINITPDSIAAFEHFNPHISASNTVGYIAGAPIDYGLPANAMYDSNGVLIPGHDVYSTYVEHGQVFQDITNTITDSVFTPNELAFPAGIGTLGIYEPRVVSNEYAGRLCDRAGALADRAKTIISQNENDDQLFTPPVDYRPDITPPPPTNSVTPDKPDGVLPPSGVAPDNKPDDNTPDDKPGDTMPDSGGEKDGKNEKRGFFGTCKDTTYKIMQCVYHGLQKTIQGVHNMKMQEIKNKNERAVERAKGVKNLKEEYGDMSVEEIHEIGLKDAAAIAQQNERLLKRLGEKRLKLQAELDMANTKQRHEIQQRLNQLELLNKEVNAFRAMGGQDATKDRIKLTELENKLKALEAQGEIDVQATSAKGGTKVQAITDKGRISHFRNATRAITNFFKGFGDKTQEDVTSADYALKLAEKNMAKAKTDSAKKQWNTAAKKLKEVLANIEYSDKQKAEIADKVIKETLRQIGQ